MEGLGAALLLRSPQPPGPGRPHADSPHPPPPYVGEQGQDELSCGGLGGAANPPPLEGSGATQISIFSALLGLWGAAEVGAP